jgi:hypothetical protein
MPRIDYVISAVLKQSYYPQSDVQITEGPTAECLSGSILKAAAGKSYEKLFHFSV